MRENERTREKKNSTEEPNKAPISNTKHIFSEAHLWLIHSGCVTELSFIDVKIKRRRRIFKTPVGAHCLRDLYYRNRS